MEKKLRKYRNTLTVTGTGLILFSFWQLVKVNMTLVLVPSFWDGFRQIAASLGISQEQLALSLFIMMAVYMVFSLIMRIYVGTNAILEGKGKRSGKKLYILLGFLMLLSDLQTLPAVVQSLFQEDAFSVRGLIALIVEMTSIYTLVELLFNALRIRRLRYLEKKGRG